MRLVSGGIHHETKTFSSTPTTLADFIRYSQLGPLLEGGNAIIERYAGTGSINGGYIDGAQAAGIELIPLLTATACPAARSQLGRCPLKNNHGNLQLFCQD